MLTLVKAGGDLVGPPAASPESSSSRISRSTVRRVTLMPWRLSWVQTYPAP